jgi:hypothetical protein
MEKVLIICVLMTPPTWHSDARYELRRVPDIATCYALASKRGAGSVNFTTVDANGAKVWCGEGLQNCPEERP